MSDRVVDELNPTQQFTRSQVELLMSFEDKDMDCITEDDAKVCDQFVQPDPVLSSVLAKHRAWITKVSSSQQRHHWAWRVGWTFINTLGIPSLFLCEPLVVLFWRTASMLGGTAHRYNTSTFFAFGWHLKCVIIKRLVVIGCNISYHVYTNL